MAKKIIAACTVLFFIFLISCKKNDSPSAPESVTVPTPVFSDTGTITPTVTQSETEGDTPTFTMSFTESPTLSATNTPTKTKTNTPTMTPTVYQWETVGSGYISSNYVAKNDIFINSGIIYVSYQHGESGMPVYVKKYDGVWSGLDGGDGKIQISGDYSNIFYDTKPYIAFGDGTSNHPKVMYYSGVSWTALPVGEFSDAAQNVSLYCYNNVPYAAYCDNDASGPGITGSMSVRKYDIVSDTWVDCGSRQFTPGTPGDFKCHGYTNIIYVFYSDSDDSHKASVMKYDPSGSAAWEFVGSRGFSDWEILYPDIYVYNNVPYVSFRDSGNGEKLTVMKYTGSGATGWEAIGGVGISASKISYTSIYVDAGDVYAAYNDWADNYRLKVIKWPAAGSAWEQVGPAVSTEGTGYPVLFFDSSVPYIFFGDGAAGSRGIVKKYAP